MNAISELEREAALILERSLNVAYADPPYEGESKQHYGSHKDFAGEVDYAELVRLLAKNFPDGWALSMKQATLRSVLNVCVVELGLKVKIGVWCKRNPTLKKNVNPTYAWEPVVFCGGRRRQGDRAFLLDWIDCPATIQRNDGGKLFVGRKPAKFCYWVFGMLGLNGNDELTDLYEGTGSVAWAWKCYKEQTSLWKNKDVFNLSGGVEKSQETHWQNGKDIPEGESLTAYTSGSKLRPGQTCGSSAPPAQKTSLA